MIVLIYLLLFDKKLQEAHPIMGGGGGDDLVRNFTPANNVCLFAIKVLLD